MELTEEIVTLARDSGAHAVAVTHAGPFPQARATLVTHKESGMSGPLRFTFDHPDEATNVRASFPWARSLVVLGHGYLTAAGAPAEQGAVVGRFATSDHYRPLRAAAGTVAVTLRERGYRAEVLVDDNRLADRLPAIRSGLGWQGRSTMVLVPGHGPWLLLGTVVTDAPLTSSSPTTRSCGTCTACLPACPTGAITEDGLDARRCLSTWLQTAGSMPLWIRPLVGRRIYGCDECLVACPPGFPPLREEKPASPTLSFAELLAASDEELVDRFSHWYIPRRQGRYLRRNLLVAAGNAGEASAWEQIRAHLGHDSSLIRGHAVWALARSGAPKAVEVLSSMLHTEHAPETRDEIETALLMFQDPHRYQELLREDEEQRAGSLSAPGGVAEPVAQRHHRLGVDLAHPGLGDS
jgi:epoxyqueuosine reductase